MTQAERAHVLQEVAERLRRLADEVEAIERQYGASSFNDAERAVIRWVADLLDKDAWN